MFVFVTLFSYILPQNVCTCTQICITQKISWFCESIYCLASCCAFYWLPVRAFVSNWDSKLEKGKKVGLGSNQLTTKTQRLFPWIILCLNKKQHWHSEQWPELHTPSGSSVRVRMHVRVCMLTQIQMILPVTSAIVYILLYLSYYSFIPLTLYLCDSTLNDCICV